MSIELFDDDIEQLRDDLTVDFKSNHRQVAAWNNGRTAYHFSFWIIYG